jgi:molecular chaperone HscC
LIDEVFARFGKEWKVAHKEDQPVLYQLVREQCERARRRLTSEASAPIKVVWKNQPYEHDVARDHFEKLADSLTARVREPVLQALRDSGIRGDSLDEVLLVGGATRMPLVRQTVTRMFGRFPSAQLNPDEVVALGAAVQAGLKMRDAALNEVVLTDVSPFTLGVETSEIRSDGSHREGIYSPIIERNTVIPASRSRTFVTMQDRQTVVRFTIFQGESRFVRDNVKLGTIEIPVPPRPAHQVSVDVRFTYDINGLLEVDVQVPESGESRQLVIVGDDSVAPHELAEQRRRLASLKVHPREKAENIAALARASRCYEQSLGDTRERVGRLLSEFESVLEQQNPRTIEEARTNLHASLDQVEGERYL